jgi:hypothetical protein
MTSEEKVRKLYPEEFSSENIDKLRSLSTEALSHELKLRLIEKLSK